MKLVTFNLRCIFEGCDGINSFIHRVGMILDKIDREKPDVLCFQEGTDQNIPYLKKHLTDYDIFFNTRAENFHGEGLALALRRETAALQALDFFWLSDTPYRPGSRFADQSNYPRICQSALIRLRDDTFFRVYNLHLDIQSTDVRVKEIGLVLARIKEDRERLAFPFMVAGDFNAEPDSETLAACLGRSDMPLKDLTASVKRSYHDFLRPHPDSKIDYILADARTAEGLCRVDVWNDEKDGITLSDHYPIAVEINFK